MKKLKIYLSGSVKNTNEKFQTWRTCCLKYAQYSNNLNIIDPIDFFNYNNKLPKTDRQCLDLFMYMIDNSDILLVNLDYTNVSIGTAMELEHAFCNNIPIIGFGKMSDTWYNWSKERCSVIFDDMEDAIIYISSTYGVI